MYELICQKVCKIVDQSIRACHFKTKTCDHVVSNYKGWQWAFKENALILFIGSVHLLHCEVKLGANLSSYALHVPLPHAPFNVVSLQGPIQKNIS